MKTDTRARQVSPNKKNLDFELCNVCDKPVENGEPFAAVTQGRMGEEEEYSTELVHQRCIKYDYRNDKIQKAHSQHIPEQ